MSGFGSVDERHRVYRLSERLADEKGRPPSPRHLKLYVNDIGALVRQFGKQFPIDHLALYTIQRRQGLDIRLWITSGTFKSDPLIQVMPDDEFVASLFCLYFGTDDELRASTLTLGGPLRQYLRSGDGDQIRQLAQVPGFWNVAETVLEKELESDEVKQGVVINIANAIDTSDLHTIVPPEYGHVVPAFARRILESAEWTQLNKDSADSAEILLRIADSSDATIVTFSRLISGEPDTPSVASDSNAWANGTAKLLIVAESLGHEARVSIPGDAAQTIKCLASAHRENLGSDVLKGLRCKCPAGEIATQVAPDAEIEWTEDESSALKSLHLAPEVKIDWNGLMAPISSRLQADTVAIPEAKRLLEAFLDLCHGLPNNIIKSASGEIAKNASFYVHVEEWSTEASAASALVALQVMGSDVGRAAATAPETGGYAWLQSLFTSPEEHNEVVNEYLAIAIRWPKLFLLRKTISQRSALDAFLKHVLAQLAEREDAAVALSLKLYLEQFGVLREELSGEIASLTINLLKSSGFKKNLINSEVDFEHANAHCELIQAGAFNESVYRKKVLDFLVSLNEETWCQEICQESAIYELLVLGCQNGSIASPQLADAVEELGLKLCSEEPPEVTWSDAPRDWSDVFKTIGADRRGTASNKIVDSLEHRVPDDLQPVIGLFGHDLAKAFAEGNHDSLVRQIAEPMIKNGDQDLLTWLSEVVMHGQIFWTAAPDDDRSTCTQSLWQRVSNEDNKEIAAVLKRIAKQLGLQEPEHEGTPVDKGDHISESDANE